MTQAQTDPESWELYPVSGSTVGDCESCNFFRPGCWYVDDDEGGTEWFLCGPCVERIREKRAAKAVGEILNEGGR
jgi:hypothetical protein